MLVAFYKGQSRIFNKFVAWWDAGPYSHTEAVCGRAFLDPVQCWSSSFMDGGIRPKEILLARDRWDILDVPCFEERRIVPWFEAHKGDKYDLKGLLSTSSPVRHSRNKRFCSEALMEAAGFAEAWRFTPNRAARVCEQLPGSRWIQGGHFRPL